LKGFIMAIPNGAGGYQYNDGNTGEALLFVQGAPTALTGAATITAAQLANGLFTFDGTAGAMTLPGWLARPATALGRLIGLRN
jgi:hypothetical protein